MLGKAELSLILRYREKLRRTLAKEARKNKSQEEGDGAISGSGEELDSEEEDQAALE